MFLITGLGNPGREYENTPHNAGFTFVNSLRESLLKNPHLQVSEWENEEKLFNSEVCKIKRGGELIGILQKPLTYMNRSGVAVQLLMKKFDIDIFVLAHDDLDIELGEYKIQEGKSPKGHNGILSVENALSSKDFTRVRIGIENRSNHNIPGEDYVLQKYSGKELEVLENTIQESISNLLPSISELL